MMINFIKTPLLTAALTFGVLSTASASLTEEDDAVLYRITPAELQALAVLFPDGNIVAEIENFLGTTAEDSTAQFAVAALDNAAGDGVASFVNATTGSAMPEILPDKSFNTRTRRLLRAQYNIANTGVLGGGNQSALIGATYTEDTYTLAASTTTLATIANHG